MTNPFLGACELKRKLPASRAVTHALRRGRLLLVSAFLLVPTLAFAQEHAAEAEHAAPHTVTDMILAMGWPIANFIIFVGILYYFFNQPFRDYLASRSTTIGKDLVEAAELKAAATAQLAAIEQKLQALPGELEALRQRGAAEIAAEEQRIAAAATVDRDRLLEQTRREIDLQVRLAKREILEHAADLSVQLATERIKKEVTPADQDRLVDRYLQQVKANNQ